MPEAVLEESYLRTCFDDMDLNKDGYITEEDMRTGIEQNIFDPVLASVSLPLQSLHISPCPCRCSLAILTRTGTGECLTRNIERRFFLFRSRPWSDEKRLRIFFRMVDRDDSGKLSVNELKLLYAASGCEVAEKDLNAFIESFDKNSDGEISEEEFIEQLKNARGY
ncbi:hypothetical protein Ciccas_006929 [Cichlidogyrus casuarinus]|uniref:EF-hand domain-containing protein n=1 Tax=Cichlidogyrus casuarinus TaxID=1844966 RepID=A0ABD2Q4K9_9PLAT